MPPLALALVPTPRRRRAARASAPRRDPSATHALAAVAALALVVPLSGAALAGGLDASDRALGLGLDPRSGAGSWLAAETYAWPLDPPVEVTAPFEAPPAPWAAGHRGVDLRAARGTPVRAPAAGTVTFVGVVAGRGVVTVTHDDGLRSSVEPVTATVAVGVRVAAGGQVGTVAPDGGHCAAAGCLHWGVRRGDVYVDPTGLLDGGPIVLLPPP